MAAPAVVTAATVDSGGVATAVTIPRPAAVQSGDLLLFFLDTSGNEPNDPTGLPAGVIKQAGFVYGTDSTGWLYSKVAGGAEPSSYTFSGFPLTTVKQITIIVVRGQHATPVDSALAATAIPSGAPSSHASNPITTLGADRLVVSFFGKNCTPAGTETWVKVSPASLVELVDVQETSDYVSVSAYAETKAVAGSTTHTVKNTLNNAVNNGRTAVTAIIAIAPAGLVSNDFPSGGIRLGGSVGSTFARVESHRTAKAQILAEASWEARPRGVFQIGVSTLDGPDALGVSAFDPEAWDGPYNVLDLKRFSVTQGKSGPLDQMEAGESTCDVRDPLGIFNPENPSSPLASVLGSRLHPFRLRGVFKGVTYGLYYGWIRSFQWQPQGRRGITQFNVVDLFWRLSHEKPTIASTGPTTTGAAIGIILDALGWTDPTLRQLAVGDAIPDFSANGQATYLQLIEGLLTAERGLFYIRGDSVAVYDDKNTTLLSTSQGTISNRYAGTSPGLDADQVRAKAKVTRTGGATQIYQDDEAALRWDAVEGVEITSPYFYDDTAAMTAATFIVGTMKNPVSPVRDVKITNAEEDLLVHILARNPGERMTLSDSHPGSGMAGDFIIQRRALSGEGAHLEASWTVTPALVFTPFLLDASVLDGAGQLGF